MWGYMDRNIGSYPNLPHPSFQPYASGSQHPESNAAYFSWPTSTQLHGAAEDRANYFRNLQKGVLTGNLDRLPIGKQATTLLDLMTIRACHSKILHRYSLGTAVGFRIRNGALTDIPAVLVFVARKVHRQWLSHIQCLPRALEGPAGIWCDVDVVEFSYYGAPAPAPKEQLYTELVDELCGADSCIGSGSQVPKILLNRDVKFVHTGWGLLCYDKSLDLCPPSKSGNKFTCPPSSTSPSSSPTRLCLGASPWVACQQTCGTLGAIVKSQTGNRQVGFLTNWHVAVDLDYPHQKMFHPLPPNHGPGVYLGYVERATSFTTDDVWYGTYASTNPETFVRVDGAFIPFADSFDISNVMTAVKGVGEIGDVKAVDLKSQINSLIGKHVVKVGRSSGLTTGTIMAYAFEYNDEKGICFFTDFLVVGENQQTFDLEGDSGSLIILMGEDGEKPRPIGFIWGGTANRGRLKLKSGHDLENWTSGVDLGRLLDLLELDLITTSAGLQEAVRKQRRGFRAGFDSTVGEPSPLECSLPKDKNEEISEALCQNIQQGPHLGNVEFHVDMVEVANNVKEYQFIPNFDTCPMHHNQEASHESRTPSPLVDLSDEDLCVSLHLGDREPRTKHSDPAPTEESPK
ncbi:protein NARROW LEAF 1 isoform X2 [Elaeis guineensis]|uniref:protein NARROW LEAF 1 isoform X2 n=1 Tax=Elaeis guineensis var. tenera TaxID=51953 RepID=UPI003C6D4C60